MEHGQSFRERVFSALSVPNYRLYFFGQGISLSGTWMQTIAQGLLVLHLTGSGAMLGLVTALQTLPVLLLGPWGGVISSRFPKRRILYVTQAVAAALALALGILTATGQVQIWMVFVLAVGLGLVNCIDNPTRQTFIMELVGQDQLLNAVSLNSTEINLARVIGPTIAGVLIATAGLAACFILNGLSYFVVIAMLIRMRAADLHPAPLTPKSRGQISEGIRYVRNTPVLLAPLVMMAIIGTLTYEFTVSLPLFAQDTFGGGANAYAAMTAAMGAGAVVGGLFTASRRTDPGPLLVRSAFLFGVTVLICAAAPSLWFALVALLAVGFFSISFTALGNATLQLNSAPEMRGRVMSLWTVAFLGSTPIGGPIVGWIGEFVSPRGALLVGGVAALVAAGIGHLAVHRWQPRTEPATDPAAR